MPAVVTASDLTKHYRVQNKAPGALATLKHFIKRETKLVEAVKSVSFEVGEGEVVGFLGPNGAGKTTTLKMLTGLIHPTSGSCEVSGHVLDQHPQPAPGHLALGLELIGDANGNVDRDREG